MAGSQNKTTHQYSAVFDNISFGEIPKTAATPKPTNPEAHLNDGDQNLNSASEIIQRPIDKPNKSRPIPRSSP